MAAKDSREVVIEATPEEILDVIADVENAPTWSPQYQSAQVLDTHDDGRPRRVKMKVKAAGITDEMEVEYSFSTASAGWKLIKSSQLRAQEGRYTLTPSGDTTKVRFDLTVDPSIPIPGFLLKRTLKGAMETATDGLRTQVLKVKRGG
ncbi:MAG: SRPBCC family protein [Mycobacterium sp.]|nr:SRPBCC family protein [Mycobacterium sp.]